MKWGVVAVCGYEIAAITTGKAPTVTALCGRYRWLAPAVLTVLAVHLYRQQPGQPKLTTGRVSAGEAK